MHTGYCRNPHEFPIVIMSNYPIKKLIFSQEGSVINPAVSLVLSAIRSFLSLTTVTVTGGNSAGEIVVLVDFHE